MCASRMGKCLSRQTQVSAVYPSLHEAIVAGPRNNAARFDLALARELLEFAVDLDAQDDRLRAQSSAQGIPSARESSRTVPAGSTIYWPQYADRWQILTDTRVQLADGTGRSALGEPSWSASDPSRNGFGPFANAWIFARARQPVVHSAGVGLPTYVVAIRGTVLSSRPSVMEDLFANTVVTQRLLQDPSGNSLPLVFAEAPGAEMHAGFGYACLSTMFDGRFGLTRALQTIAEKRAAIVLTGHSQGAAMATLLHAFLRYAIGRKWLFADQEVLLSSYAFAQPKPGNAFFAADFDRWNASDGGSFTINNSLDPVPAVPLTRQTLSDLSKDLPTASSVDRFIDAIGFAARLARYWLSSRMDRQIVEFMGSDDLLLDPRRKWSLRVRDCEFLAGSSRNFVLAGTPISLLGDPGARYASQDPADPFIQHHTVTYRELLGRTGSIVSDA